MKKENKFKNKVTISLDIDKIGILPEPPKPYDKQKFNIVKKSIWGWYVIPSIILISIIMYYIVAFVMKIQLFYTILVSLIAIPLGFISIAVILLRFFIFEKKKIKKAITLNFTHDYIIMNFFLENKRLSKEIININKKTGYTLDIGEETYLIDNKCIWLDEKGRPNSFYIRGIPNPLKFNFKGKVEEFIKALKDKNIDNIKDFDNEKIDISYSSVALQLFKKDRFFEELHRDPDQQKEFTKVVGMFVIIIVILIIALILAIIL